MNLLVDILGETEVDSKPLNSKTLIVEDCVGEAIHIHFRNLRLEMSIDDFETFVVNLQQAKSKLDRWE